MTSITIVGYASVDSSAAIDEFRGLDATSIVRRPLVSTTPGMGGIAHLTAAVAGSGHAVRAVSWVGPDRFGTLWRDAVASSGAEVAGVAVRGTRSPSATLIEVATGGTICLFDPGDCHPDAPTDEQLAAVGDADWVLITVAPSAVTRALLDAVPPDARLAWAVKHDDDAYPGDLVHRLLARADVVSFSRGERAWLTFDGMPPERALRPGALAVETLGRDGVRWAVASASGPVRLGELTVPPVDADDTTGAGDTFIGTLIGGLAGAGRDPHDDRLAELIGAATRASGDLLRGRITTAPPGAPSPEENH